MQRRTAIVAVVVSAACFGTLAVLASLAYERGAEPLQLLAWRFGLASVLLTIYVGVTRPRSLRVPRADVMRFAALSVLGYGFASLCFFFALRYTDASIVAVLFYTYPAMVAVVGVLTRGEVLDVARFSGVLLAFVGCVLVMDPFTATGGVHRLGVLLGLGAAAGYASFTVLSHRWMPGRFRSTLMTYTFGFTALLVTSVAVATGSTLSPVEWGWEVWALLAAIVLLPTFAAVLLYLRALSRIGTGQASLLSTSEPIFTIVLAAVLLGERLSLVQGGGAALVLLGVLVAELRARRAEQLPVV